MDLICLKNCIYLSWLSVYFCFVNTAQSFNKNIVFTDYENIVSSGIFVDKSNLISEILDSDEKVFFITRPKKWGKTVNLNMMYQFFNVELDYVGNPITINTGVNYRLFKMNSNFTNNREEKMSAPFKISLSENAMSHMGKHPVIFLNLKYVTGSSVPEVEKKLQQTVTLMFRSYPFLSQYLSNKSDLLDNDEKLRLNNFLNGNYAEEYLFDSLDFLSMLLFEHFQSPVCILVDDYDVPIIHAILTFSNRGENFEYVTEMFRRFYEYTFKENHYIFKAVISGTLNFDVVPNCDPELKYRYISYNTLMNDTFSQFYGFTSNEINEILLNSKMVHGVVDSDLKKWYGGVHLNSIEIFNPSSVVQYISSNGKYDYYLLKGNESDFNNLFYRAFLSDSLFEELLLLAEGKTVTTGVISNFTPLRLVHKEFYSMFVHAGYLISIPPSGRYTEHPIWRVKIPNEEIKGIFANGFKIWFCNTLNITLTEYTNLKDLIIAKEGGKFWQHLQDLLMKTDKYNFKTNETHYHNLMAGFSASLMMEYSVEYIRELDQCRGECVIVPKNINVKTAINIEYTVCKPWQKMEEIVKSSLSDLVNRPLTCSNKIRTQNHIKEIFYISVGFCGSKMVMMTKLINLK